MEKFIFNYVKQFETVLMYIRSIREGDIEIHLHSLFEILKYFFAHNNLTYARLIPLQLHAYQLVKKEFLALWQEFLKGNFVITKSKIKFTSIGLDHGLEQEIKSLKFWVALNVQYLK